MEWTEQKPTVSGWYHWFREEYDVLRREVFHVDENLKAVKIGESERRRTHVDFIVGGLWFGPIPPPPMPALEAYIADTEARRARLTTQ